MKQIILAALAATFLMTACDSAPKAEEKKIDGYTDREAIQNIFDRKSVRSFTDQAVEQQKIDLLVRAGLAAPTGSDKRPWHFVVVSDTKAMRQLSVDLPYAKMLEQCPLAIAVCGDPEISANWYIDCSAATENILLAAEALGLGAVWTGVYPYEERITQVQNALGIPENIIPLSLIPIGYPDGEHTAKDKYDASRVHQNGW